MHRRTILVSGMIATVPYQGGATWAVLQYLLGFQELGFTVYFVEPIAAASLRPSGSRLAQSVNAAYFREVVAAFGLTGRAVLLDTETVETVGLSYAALRDVAAGADVLLNIAGMLTDEALIEAIPVRIYLDLDPAFTQLWHAQGINMRFAGHTHFVTVGQSIGSPSCAVPAGGLPWLTTWPPIVRSHWPATTQITAAALTTVANWRSYGSLMVDGTLYGQKAHSLRQFIQVPTLTDERFLLALAIHPNEVRDLAALRAHGWQLTDPAIRASTPARYQQFIQGSKAEFGIAKQGYVVSRCGWFSDRSVCYLASGRPVLAQDTGYSAFLPTGAGLLSFATEDDLLARIEDLNRDYAGHARAAREIAHSFFDAHIVLFRLLAQVGVEI